MAPKNEANVAHNTAYADYTDYVVGYGALGANGCCWYSRGLPSQEK
jgi:hypothetical protein